MDRLVFSKVFSYYLIFSYPVWTRTRNSTSKKSSDAISLQDNMECSGAAVPWGTYTSYSSLAAPTGFEPVPHGVTSRHCIHSTMEPKERVGVVETPSSLWKSDIMSRYTKPAYKKTHFVRLTDWLPFRRWGCPVNSGPRGTRWIRTTDTLFFRQVLYQLSYGTIKKLRSPTLVRGGTFGHLQHPLNFISFANIQTFSLSR